MMGVPSESCVSSHVGISLWSALASSADKAGIPPSQAWHFCEASRNRVEGFGLVILGVGKRRDARGLAACKSWRVKVCMIGPDGLTLSPRGCGFCASASLEAAAAVRGGELIAIEGDRTRCGRNARRAARNRETSIRKKSVFLLYMATVRRLIGRRKREQHR